VEKNGIGAIDLIVVRSWMNFAASSGLVQSDWSTRIEQTRASSTCGVASFGFTAPEP